MALPSARYNHEQQVGFIAAEFNFSNIPAAGIAIGAIPRRSRIVHCHVIVDTAFNAGTTNTVNVGTTPTGADVAPSATIAPGTAGYKNVDTPKTLQFTADTVLYMSYAQAGAVATAGKGFLYIAYVPSNDFGGQYV